MENGIARIRKQKNQAKMKELSLHILDIVRNSIQANASKIDVEITEDNANNRLEIRITDNGDGMDKSMMNQILNPFYSTKNKKTGLGIPLLKQHAKMTGGNLTIKSIVNRGTTICALFVKEHLDRQPMGDIAGTLTNMIRSNPEIHFRYIHKVGSKSFELDSAKLIKELDGLKINTMEVIRFLEQMIKENLHDIGAG